MLTVDTTAAKTFWNEQLATGSPLLSGPVTSFAPSGTYPVDDASLTNLAQTAATPNLIVPAGLTGSDLLAAALSQVTTSTEATFALSGGVKQTSWSSAAGPLSLDSSSRTLDLRQLPEPSTLVFNGVDNVDDSLSLDLSTLPRTPDGKSVVNTIVYNGGAGGFDTMTVSGGHFSSEIYIPTGKDSGIVEYRTGDLSTPADLTIIFTGLEPFNDYTTADSFYIPGTANDDQIYAVDPLYWTGASVFYGEVVSIDKHENTIDGRTVYLGSSVRLRPIATLTGDVDAAYQGEISASTLIAEYGTSAIHDAPTNGSKVIVLVQHAVGIAGKNIPTGDISFFPKDKKGERPALFNVTNFDDPKVTETIENLRKLRGKQHEEAEQKAAAEKKGK